MKYAQAQKDALALLVKHPKAVSNCICSVGKVGIIIDDVVGYVIPKDANWIDLERVERVLNLRNLGLPLMSAENKLEPTENLVDKGDTIVREFRKPTLRQPRPSISRRSCSRTSSSRPSTRTPRGLKALSL